MNNQNHIPTLTLDAGGAAMPSPTFDVATVTNTAMYEVEQAAPLEESRLSPEEQKLITDFSDKIDLTNSAQILKYGSAAQEKVANFADTALESVKTKEMGEVGDMILSLVGELREFQPEEEKKGLLHFSVKILPSLKSAQTVSNQPSFRGISRQGSKA